MVVMLECNLFAEYELEKAAEQSPYIKQRIKCLFEYLGGNPVAEADTVFANIEFK